MTLLNSCMQLVLQYLGHDKYTLLPVHALDYICNTTTGYGGS